jgi:hypothetical protein
VEKMDLSSIGDEQLQTILRERILGKREGDCGNQKVVSVDNVDEYLEQGWEFVATLPNDKVIIKLSQNWPAHPP